MTVEVPAGVTDGLELRIAGGGHAGRAGGPPGDLYVALDVQPHPVFERRGQDLFAVLEVPMTQAALGAEIEVPTLDGTEKVKLDAGTGNGQLVRLKGRGVPHLGRKARGDLFLSVHVTTPEPRSREERKLMEQIAQLRREPTGKGPHPATLRRPTLE
jgi:molecular chaperone DnaJ